jgi:LysM repeat protein
MLPILLATLGVAVVLVALVIIPALFGHGGGAAAASASASSAHASAPVVSDSPNSSGSTGTVASPDASGAPQPLWTYTQYKVVAGDSVSKIAKKFGIQQWELLLANPQIVNGIVKLGSNLNIPPPGVLTPAPSTPAAS